MKGHRTRYRWAAALVSISVVGGFVVLSACSNQGEGERCETANNNEDCASGLICFRKEDVNAPYQNADRCCPADRSQATHPACTTPVNPVAGDSAPPPDTGPVTDAATGDADATSLEDANDASDASDADANEQ